MLTLVPEKIEAYCEAHTTPESEVFRALAKKTYADVEYPMMQVGHLEGAFLRMVVRMCRAERILEIGTFTGYSTLAMAEALPEHGRIVTCDIDPETTAIARSFWDRTPHGEKIDARTAPALETIAKLDGPFDLVFIDADKTNYKNYWEAVLPKVRPGGMILSDNVLWSGRVLEPKEESDRAIVEYNAHVAKDPRVETVMVSVRDGISLSWKKP